MTHRSRQHPVKSGAHTSPILGLSFLLLIVACKPSEANRPDSGASAAVAASETTATQAAADPDWDWMIVPFDCDTSHKKCKGPQLEIHPGPQVHTKKPGGAGSPDVIMATFTNTTKKNHDNKNSMDVTLRVAGGTRTLKPTESATWVMKPGGASVLRVAGKPDIPYDTVRYHPEFGTGQNWKYSRALFNPARHGQQLHEVGPWVTCDLGCCTGQTISISAQN